MVPMSPADALPHISAILAEGGSCRLVITGNSMLPFLRDKRDGVILIPPTGEIQRDEIVFYLRSPNVCVLHRVWQVNPDGSFLICGDAQTALEPIRREQILARISHIERNGHSIPVSSPLLRLQVRLWRWLYPVRPRMLALLRRLHLIHIASDSNRQSS